MARALGVCVLALGVWALGVWVWALGVWVWALGVWALGVWVWEVSVGLRGVAKAEVVGRAGAVGQAQRGILAKHLLPLLPPSHTSLSRVLL